MENNTKKQRLFNLPETKGNFMIKGVVKGTKKDNFYTEKQTRTGKEMRIVNFGLEYDEGRDLYIGFTGIEQEKVYFYKKPEEKGKKGTSQPVSWANRFKFAEDPKNEGFRLIGKNLGLTKVTNEKGEQVNDKKVLTDYDACAEIRNLCPFTIFTFHLVSFLCFLINFVPCIFLCHDLSPFYKFLNSFSNSAIVAFTQFTHLSYVLIDTHLLIDDCFKICISFLICSAILNVSSVITNPL